ncbi:MAG: PD-(D/E)XK nuclease family protein, partial [Bacillota bacterium]
MDQRQGASLADIAGVGLHATPAVIPHIRTSERRDFKRCQQRWQWRWRAGLYPRTQKPGALWFGTGMHLALEHYYGFNGTRRGTRMIDVWNDYVGDMKAIVYGENYSEDRSDFMDAAELGRLMLEAYVEHYGLDERWHVLSAEQTFALPIPYPERSPRAGQPLAVYNGTFDLVARDLEDDTIWVWDHKNLKSVKVDHLALDDQAGAYWAVAGDVLAAQGIVPKGTVLNGILYNILRKAKPDDRPINPVTR